MIDRDLVKALRAVGVTDKQILDAQNLAEEEKEARSRLFSAGRSKQYRDAKSLKTPDVVTPVSVTQDVMQAKSLKSDEPVTGTSVTRKPNKEKFPHTPSKEKTFSDSQNLLLPLKTDSISEAARESYTRKNGANGVNGHDHFADFWAAFPNKVGKRYAETCFQRALERGITVEQIADGLQRYIDTKPDDRAWCNPSTFLNQDRCLDEPAERPPPNLSPNERYRNEIHRIFRETQQEAEDEEREKWAK